MDNESSPIRTSKRRKSDDTEENDNQPEPSTSSHSGNNNANSSEVAATSGEEDIRKAPKDERHIGDSGIGVEERAEQELDGDANETSPLPPTDGVDVDAEVVGLGEIRFRSRPRRSTGRPRNYRTRLITPSSSSSSSLDSLEGVHLRQRNQIPSVNSDHDETSSDSHGHISAPEFEMDSSLSEVDSPFGFASSTDEAAVAEETAAINEVINKQKPPYTWVSAIEIMHRENGLSGDGRRTLRNGIPSGFQTRFYGSRHVVERMQKLHSMHKHNGCVNCLNFNRAGDLLCTGSDDMKVVVWDWAASKPKFTYKSGHTENIFQTKFVEMYGGIDIVSTSRDGQIRVALIPPSGGKVRTRSLYKHSGPVHKLALCPQNPFVILSAGEDGRIICCDLRKSPVTRLKTVKEEKRKVPLYSIAHHPFDPQICVCGNDNYVRVFDKRNMNKTVHKMSPQRLADLSMIPHITCCVYNSTGSEILASYSDDDIYLFDNIAYTSGQFNHRYRGHFNHKTIKGVNFFGPNSEYVISGSDCGNIFFWDKNTEAIINFMPGDNGGVVNCLEPHPKIPILATSGLDADVKIWAPTSKTYPPAMIKLEKCIKKNLKRSVVEEMDGFDDRQFYYFVRQFLRNSRPSDNNDSSINDPHVHLTSSSSSDSDEDFQFSSDQITRALRPSCNTQ